MCRQTINYWWSTQFVPWSVANSTWNNYWTLSLQKTVCSLGVNNFNEWPQSTASEKRPIFFLRFEEQGESFPDSVVTEDETWVLLKFWGQNTINGMALFQLTGQKEVQTTFSVQKIMATVFRYQKGPLLVEFFPQSQTINATCCEILHGHPKHLPFTILI